MFSFLKKTKNDTDTGIKMFSMKFKNWGKGVGEDQKMIALFFFERG